MSLSFPMGWYISSTVRARCPAEEELCVSCVCDGGVNGEAMDPRC